jgi:hypothetical protein
MEVMVVEILVFLEAEVTLLRVGPCACLVAQVERASVEIPH